MSHDLAILAATAAGIGFVHTLIGPDHYLPFVVLGRARNWSLARTSWITLLCGLGHVAGSVLLGLVGIALGVAVSRLEAFESARGGLAAWLLIAFGLLYGAWGLRRALRGREHAHLHLGRGRYRPHPHHHTVPGHAHAEDQAGDGGDAAGRTGSAGSGAVLPADLGHRAHLRAHVEQVAARPSATPWVLFIVFVLGPCEPLIPLLMYPAAIDSPGGLVLVTAVFAVTTVGTMLAVVALATLGVDLLPMGRLERYSHALAGAAIALSGLSIELLGL